MFDNILNTLMPYTMSFCCFLIVIMVGYKAKLLFDFYVVEGYVPWAPVYHDIHYSDPAITATLVTALCIFGGSLFTALMLTLIIYLFKSITLWWGIALASTAALVIATAMYARVCRKKYLVIQTLKGT